MRRLCAALGDPQNRVPSILIAGTNGKGSTAATLARNPHRPPAIASASTPARTSPRVNERIQLAHPVMPSEYGSFSAHGSEGAQLLTPHRQRRLRPHLHPRRSGRPSSSSPRGDLPAPPSFFERLTAIAFAYFGNADQPRNPEEASSTRAEIMVLEVGLGGRLDATNIVEPLLSVITDIALDHQDYLGSTIREIAQEKAGILRQDGVLVALSQHPDANRAVGEIAQQLHTRGGRRRPLPAPGTTQPARGRPQKPAWRDALRNRYTLTLPESGAAGPGLLEVDSPLPGTHQQRNLARRYRRRGRVA